MRATGVAAVVGVALALVGAGWLFLQSVTTKSDGSADDAGREGQAARAQGPELAGRKSANALAAAVDEGRFEVPGIVVDADRQALAAVRVEARFLHALPAPGDWDDSEPSLFGPEFGLKEPLEEPPPVATATSSPDGTFALVVRRRGEFS